VTKKEPNKTSGAQCPKCGIAMKIVAGEGVETDECPKCGGIWVDRQEEKRVLEMKPAVFTVEELRMLRKVYQPFGTSEPVRYVPCPRCGELMWRKNYMHHSGIIVDTCRSHGTFFDKGELEKAIEFINKGGIEYEKLKLTEHGVAEAREKLAREIGRVEMSVYRLHWIGRFLSCMGF